MKPARIEIFPSGELGIVWEDGHESFYSGKELRCQCRCALCVDEATGRKILDDARVPGDVRPARADPVGNYGINIAFSDGHSTGIYANRWLREHCPCGGPH